MLKLTDKKVVFSFGVLKNMLTQLLLFPNY